MNNVEYLIVGQGLAGTMLAFEMLDRGISFQLVSSPQKSKASLVAAGMVNPLVFKRLTKSWQVDELLPFMKKRYRELEKILNSHFYFDKTILKPLSAQEMLLWKERQNDPGFQDYISEVSEYTGIPGIRPAAAYGKVSGAGFLSLSDFLSQAETYFQKKGLLTEGLIDPSELPFNSESIGIKAEKIIFCEGYHLHKNPLFDFVKMNPAKGEVLLIHAPELSDDYILNKQVFVLPVGDHHFKVGSTYEWEDLTEQTTQEGKDSILQRLENLIQVDYEVVNHWAGVRPTISDRRPVLGLHPDIKNVFVFNGLGTKGVMLAPKMASVFCDFLTIHNYTLPKEIDVNRFK